MTTEEPRETVSDKVEEAKENVREQADEALHNVDDAIHEVDEHIHPVDVDQPGPAAPVGSQPDPEPETDPSGPEE